MKTVGGSLRGDREIIPWVGTPIISSNMFSQLQFSFLQFNYKNSNVSVNVISDMQWWLSGQSGALSKREIAGSDPNGALLP